LAFASLPALRQVTMASTPGARSAAGGVDVVDPAFGDRGAQDVAIGGVGRDVMAFIGIGRAARGLQRPIDAVDGLADHPEAVDDVGAGRLVELHG
jgi:hypothetical protein